MANENKIWNMPLFVEAYNDIAINGKMKEGRVPDYTKPEKDYRTMKTGDIMRFYAANQDFSPIENMPEIRLKVLYIYHYDNIEEMIETEGLKSLLPNAKNNNEAIKIYLGFPEYPERVRKYGVYAITLGRE